MLKQSLQSVYSKVSLVMFLKLINPILHGLFDHRILYEGGQKFPLSNSLTKSHENPNLACGLMLTKNFRKNWF